MTVDTCKITTVTVTSFSTNCYIVRSEGSKTCVIIDPGGDGKKILRKVKELGLSVNYVFCTHGHPDHTGGVEDLCRETGAEFFIGKGDENLIEKPPQYIVDLLPSFKNPPKNYKTFSDDVQICLEGLDITVIRTPGHTPGSISYLINGSIFSGDTLFRESVGRTDLPGGDFNLEISNIKSRLLTHLDKTVIYPGHGPQTTVGYEKVNNPFLQ